VEGRKKSDEGEIKWVRGEEGLSFLWDNKGSLSFSHHCIPVPQRWVHKPDGILTSQLSLLLHICTGVALVVVVVRFEERGSLFGQER
jgi:hypothetical protein